MGLVDQHNRSHTYLRISLTEKCNLRCRYCMPEHGIPLQPHAALMQANEVYEIARQFVAMGVNKIRLTGGEPLVRKDFKNILLHLADLPVELAISTNGVLLHHYFDLFAQVGLRKVNISIDSLQEEKFERITRRNQFALVMKNMEEAIARGFRVKVNVVLMKGFNDDEITDFIAFTRHRKVSLRFIEFMPFQGNNWQSDKLVSLQEIMDAARATYGSDVMRISDEKNDTSKNYKIRGFQGSWGVISTVTAPFCSDCNRMRLTANGRMKNCLFSNNEVDLLGALRNKQNIEPLVVQCVGLKKAVRAGMDSPQKIADQSLHQKNRSMTSIGG
jgi:molybdenum cofactor biosynthesis protein A